MSENQSFYQDVWKNEDGSGIHRLNRETYRDGMRTEMSIVLSKTCLISVSYSVTLENSFDHSLNHAWLLNSWRSGVLFLHAQVG